MALLGSVRKKTVSGCQVLHLNFPVWSAARVMGLKRSTEHSGRGLLIQQEPEHCSSLVLTMAERGGRVHCEDTVGALYSRLKIIPAAS